MSLTNEQVYDPQLALRQTIALILDKPSLYMGGPSRQNLKRADEIIAAIRGDSRLMQAMGAHEPDGNVVRLHTANSQLSRVSEAVERLLSVMRRDGMGTLACYMEGTHITVKPSEDSDQPIDYDIEEAIRIAGLWRAGKMIGGDEVAVRDALLAEVERLRLPETKF